MTDRWNVPASRSIGPWRLGVSEWTLRESSTVGALERISRAGFDFVELAVTAGTDTTACRRALAATGLAATAVCPLFGDGDDFSSTDRGRRRSAVDLLLRSIDCAQESGAAVVIVVPSGNPDVPTSPRQEHVIRAAETIAWVAQRIPPGGPTLVIEPLNRYETHLVHTVDQAAEVARLTGEPAVAVMGDVFHMNIEEPTPWESLHRNGNLLRHVHLADSNRRAPGLGHIDFPGLFGELASLDYAGSLVIECLPAKVESLSTARTFLTGLMSPPGPA